MLGGAEEVLLELAEPLRQVSPAIPGQQPLLMLLLVVVPLAVLPLLLILDIVPSRAGAEAVQAPMVLVSLAPQEEAQCLVGVQVVAEVALTPHKQPVAPEGQAAKVTPTPLVVEAQEAELAPLVPMGRLALPEPMSFVVQAVVAAVEDIETEQDMMAGLAGHPVAGVEEEAQTIMQVVHPKVVLVD